MTIVDMYNIFNEARMVHPDSWGYIDFKAGEEVTYKKDIAAMRAFIPEAEMLTVFGATTAGSLCTDYVEQLVNMFDVRLYTNIGTESVIALPRFNYVLSLENIGKAYVKKGIIKTLKTFGASQSIIACVDDDFEDYKELGILNTVFVKMAKMALGENYGDYVVVPYDEENEKLIDIAIKLFYILGPSTNDMSKATAWPTVNMFRYAGKLFNTNKVLAIPLDTVAELGLLEFEETEEGAQKVYNGAKRLILNALTEAKLDKMIYPIVV